MSTYGFICRAMPKQASQKPRINNIRFHVKTPIPNRLFQSGIFHVRFFKANAPPKTPIPKTRCVMISVYPRKTMLSRCKNPRQILAKQYLPGIYSLRLYDVPFKGQSLSCAFFLELSGFHQFPCSASYCSHSGRYWLTMLSCCSAV